MNIHQSFQWNSKKFISFTKGNRIYYTQFSISNDERFIKYASTIYKKTGTEINIENHLHTVKERFSRFPVIARMSEKIVNEMDSIKTRSSKNNFFKSKKFINFLIQNYVKYGVGHRQGKKSYFSIRKKIIDNRKAIISKKKNRHNTQQKIVFVDTNTMILKKNKQITTRN